MTLLPTPCINKVRPFNLTKIDECKANLITKWQLLSTPYLDVYSCQSGYLWIISLNDPDLNPANLPFHLQMEANVSSHKWTLCSQSSPTQPRPLCLLALFFPPSHPQCVPCFLPFEALFLMGICVFHVLNSSKPGWRGRSKPGFVGSPAPWKSLHSEPCERKRKMFWLPSLNLFHLLVFLAAALPAVDDSCSHRCSLFDCKVRTFLANLPWRALSILIFEHAAGSDIEDLGGKWRRVGVGGQSPELYEAALPILLFQDEDKKKVVGILYLRRCRKKDWRDEWKSWSLEIFLLWHVAGKHLWEDFFFFLLHFFWLRKLQVSFLHVATWVANGWPSHYYPLAEFIWCQ